jgi:hypothetical protein
MAVVEIEVDNAQNRNLFFLPLQRPVRGRLDFGREADPEAIRLTRDFPTPIPGQRIQFDADREEAALLEPLHGEDHRALRELIARKNYGALEPERQVFPVPKDQQPTWFYWLRRAVNAGLARVVRGALPELTAIRGKVKKSWITPERGPDRKDRMIDKLLNVLGSILPAGKRRELEQALEAEEN